MPGKTSSSTPVYITVNENKSSYAGKSLKGFGWREYDGASTSWINLYLQYADSTTKKVEIAYKSYQTYPTSLPEALVVSTDWESAYTFKLINLPGAAGETGLVYKDSNGFLRISS